jgi:hypothetical protein
MVLVCGAGKDKGTDAGKDTKDGRGDEPTLLDALAAGEIDNDHGHESEQDGYYGRTRNQTHNEGQYNQQIRPYGNLGFMVFTVNSNHEKNP